MTNINPYELQDFDTQSANLEKLQESTELLEREWSLESRDPVTKSSLTLTSCVTLGLCPRLSRPWFLICSVKRLSLGPHGITGIEQRSHKIPDIMQSYCVLLIFAKVNVHHLDPANQIAEEEKLKKQ